MCQGVKEAMITTIEETVSRPMVPDNLYITLLGWMQRYYPLQDKHPSDFLAR
jgi:hypothetical protein